MKVGFTGTQRGLSVQQYGFFTTFFPNAGLLEFHHGDCVGADQQVHNIVAMIPEQWRPKIVLHPPIVETKRAFVFTHIDDEIREPRDYLDRNHDIVDETELLVAAPGEHQEVLRSGTWATIRYARKRGRPVLIVYPNGTTNAKEFSVMKF